jgi:phospholipid/cholesterol/gamma-HCH transport system substrate-binding protein
MDQLDTYLGEIDDHLPTLREDLIKLADVADTYDLAAPDLLGVMRDVTITGQTVIDNKQEIGTFFSDLQGLADTGARVLSDNETNIIRVGQVTEPMLRLLAVYSPEFPCLIKGAARYRPRLARTFEGNQIKQYIEFGTAQYRAYGEVGHGPWCLGLPYPPVPSPPIALDDGSDVDDHPPTSPIPGSANRVGVDYSGSEGEQQVVNALLAQRSGRAADSYGSLGSLMYGPLVREPSGGARR